MHPTGSDHLPDEEKIPAGLGMGYWCLGEYDPAAFHFARALEICLTHLGPDHPTTLSRMKNLGWTYLYQGRYKEAQQLFEKALQGMRMLNCSSGRCLSLLS